MIVRAASHNDGQHGQHGQHQKYGKYGDKGDSQKIARRPEMRSIWHSAEAKRYVIKLGEVRGDNLIKD